MFDLSRQTGRLAIVAYAALVAFAHANVPSEQRPAVSEHAVKAAIVFKIAKFVTWPERAFADHDQSLSICLPVNDPMAPALRSLKGQTVHGRMIDVQPFDRQSKHTHDCQILFLSGTDDPWLFEMLSHLTEQPVLTIGDSADFTESGGIVTLMIDKSRVRFAINMAASDRAGLDISAHLLQLATITNDRTANR